MSTIRFFFPPSPFAEITRMNFEEFKTYLDRTKSETMAALLAASYGETPFHYCICKFFSNDNYAAMKYLFQEAKRLNINPSSSYKPLGENPSNDKVWNDTPLHQLIANEEFDSACVFIQCAKKAELNPGLNCGDRENKLPLHLALMMGNAPLALIKELITAENYNQPDKHHYTPMMLACITRREDAIQLICETALGKQLNLNHLEEEDVIKLQPLMKQTHPISEKSLVHFGVLRCGTETSLQKEDTYRETVFNVLKAVWIDPRRDEKATRNAARNEIGDIITFKDEENADHLLALQIISADSNLQKRLGLSDIDKNKSTVVFAIRSAIQGIDKPNTLLCSKENRMIFAGMGSDLLQRQYKRKNLLDYNANFTGYSYADSIVRRTPKVLHLLHQLGANFSLKQKLGDKTPKDYLHTLLTSRQFTEISDTDRRYLDSALSQLKQCEANAPIISHIKIRTVGY